MGLAVQFESLDQRLVAHARGFGLLEGLEHIGHGLGGTIHEANGLVVNRLDPIGQFLFSNIAAGLAGVLVPWIDP